jgi:uroporphyrinogen-III decarboxylase
MNSRQRFKASLEHKDPGKIVVDFSSTAVTGMHVLAIKNLREYYSLPERPVKVIEPYQMLGELEPDLRDIIGIDVVGVFSRNNMFGVENKGFKEFRMFWGQEVLVPAGFKTKYDKNGDLMIYPEGDTSVAPSAKMPKASYFFDSIIRQKPIVESRLNPEDNTEEFKLFGQEDIEHWEKTIQEIRNTDKGVMANVGGTALGDIALLPGPAMKNPKGIRDISEWYMSTLTRQDYIHQIFAKQTEIALKNLETFHQIAGDAVDAIYMCGTDFGSQDSLFCDPDTFDSLYAPYYTIMNNWVHKNTTWKCFKHSCGAVEPLIPNFIKAGFDILNPVQINASGMDPVMLKEKYGSEIVFWGGGVDTQKMLPYGNPINIREQVLKQCDIFGKNGGFVFNTVHNVQANIPVENIVAMINALHEVNK